MKKHGAYHLIISVTNGKVSKRFYDKLFKELKWKTVYEDPDAAGYSDGDFTLWVVPAENKKTKQHDFKSVGFHHFSVRVPQRKDVDKMYEWCRQNKVKVVDVPAHYPQYNKNYYAVFFLDPDGMKLEVTYV